MAVSAVISVLLALVCMGLIKEHHGWHSLARCSTVGWSKRERREQYSTDGSAGICRGAGRSDLMASCVSNLSSWRIAREGEGWVSERSGSILLPAHALGWFTRLALASIQISTCLIQGCSGRAFASMDGSLVMLCVIYTVRYALSVTVTRCKPDPTPCFDIDALQRVTRSTRRL